VFKLFRKRGTKPDTQVHAIEPDKASGDEPIPRYPGSWMTQHGTQEEGNQVRTYIQYETKSRIDTVAGWFLKQLRADGWTYTSWTPPYVVGDGAKGTEPFITLVCEKWNATHEFRIYCSVGMNWYPSHVMIWVDHEEPVKGFGS
jgi:hypothetical protein